ncbi:hypothetical protein SOPP22_14840 [Shewanella sp. OPT22]|nr:hypothetical protein SOPP22_14840 [Shewanella sp. OPT22]
MNEIYLYVYILLGIISLFNLIATVVVFRTYFENKMRRVYQLLFIWLVPFFGAILAIYLNREDRFTKKTKRKVGNDTSISDTYAGPLGR